MSYIWMRWLADEFRAAGLKVVEVEGWKNRGRPASTGNFVPRAGVTNHHTGTRASIDSPHPTLRVLIQGRSDLPGPLCHWSVGYDGTVYVVAAGRANHAGRTDKPVVGVPAGADGNAHFAGDEIESNGTQAMPAAQRHSVAVTNAVWLDHFKRDVDRVHRHQDLTVRKWDIGSISTATLRADARAVNLKEDDMPYNDWPQADKDALVNDILRADIIPIPKSDADNWGEASGDETSPRNMLTRIVEQNAAILKALGDLGKA